MMIPTSGSLIIPSRMQNDNGRSFRKMDLAQSRTCLRAISRTAEFKLCSLRGNSNIHRSWTISSTDSCRASDDLLGRDRAAARRGRAAAGKVEQLDQLAHQDLLIGLPNRRGFMRQLERADRPRPAL